MHKKYIPIPYEAFPREREVVDGTNCLAFALGIYEPKWGDEREEYNLERGITIKKAFLKKVRELGFDIQNFKRIKTEDEANCAGYVIRVYDFVKVKLNDGTITEDFHVIRREPNGKWFHKPGYGYYQRRVSIEDWIIILRQYGDRFVSFVIEV
jgi:hypothetical protein